MKNIDGKGHSILYPASQSGKPQVLNLIMKQSWWRECLEQEQKKRKTTEEWESFVSNVCAAGCNELARIILKQNSDLLKAKSDNPLMR